MSYVIAAIILGAFLDNGLSNIAKGLRELATALSTPSAERPRG